MGRIGFASVVILAIAAAYGLGRLHNSSPADSNTSRRVLYYVDPMHPAYKSDKPGIAPDCGMKLEPVYSDSRSTNPANSQSLTQLPAGTVRIDTPTRQLLGITVAEVARNAPVKDIRVVGRVMPEDTRVYRLNPGADGFIRETYNDSVGVRVKKDQKLATYYAPEVLAPASGFLAAIQAVPGSVGKDGARTAPMPGELHKQGVSSVQGFTDRLLNLGVSEVQIKKMAETRQLPETIDIVAPADGFIVARNISAGQHFGRDIEFYRIADLDRVWVVAEVSEREASFLHAGGIAEITLRDSAHRLSARISESLPQSESGGGTVKLRLEADNPSCILRPEMLVDVKLSAHLPAAVTVPVDAVVDSGAHSRVYIENSDGIFEPRLVETGWRTGEQVEILKGLQPGERVVSAATFLVDSESRLTSRSDASATSGSTASPLSQPTLSQPTLSQPTLSQPPPGRPKTTSAVSSDTVKDPSCGMPVDKEKALAAGNVLVDGTTSYYFCSKKCKDAFHHQSTAAARDKRAS